VADAFTRGNGEVPGLVFQERGEGLFGVEVIEGVGSDEMEHLALPRLVADGVTKVLRCEAYRNNGFVNVGDHVLIIAKVHGIIDSPEGEEMEKGLENGLCYADARYRRIGEVIDIVQGEELQGLKKNK